MAWYFGCKFSLLLDKLYHTAYNRCEGDNIKHNVCCSPHYLNQKLILKLVHRKDRQILLGQISTLDRDYKILSDNTSVFHSEVQHSGFVRVMESLEVTEFSYWSWKIIVCGVHRLLQMPNQ